MGTSWTVRLVAPRTRDLRAVHAAVEAELAGVVAQMSNWEPASALSLYNASAAGTRHAIAPAFRHVLMAALDIAEASDGAFDPTVGPAVDAWGFGPSRAPAPDARADAAARIGWRRVVLQDDALVQPGAVHLDFCGIAKGYAVDAVVARLRALGVGAAMVEVGGEVAAYGRKPDGSPWRVLVEAWSGDEDDAQPARIVALDGLAIATSGDRWHRRDEGARRISHTLDPRTGAPVQASPAAVTVLHREAMRADAWATALTVLGTGAGFALASELGLAARFIACADDRHAEHMTPAFAAALEP